MKKILFGALVTTTMLFSCSKDRDEVIEDNPEASVEVKTAVNLKVPSYGSGSTEYVLYNLKKNEVVASDQKETTKWDIGFNGTTIIVNGGSARNKEAKGAALVVNKAYEEVKEAPADSEMKRDDMVDGEVKLAITKGSGNGWYNYDISSHVIIPIKNRTIVIKTADGKYAKMKITSYYKDAPENPTMTTPSGYYHFTYAYQTNGSKTFSK
ncbi:HmuY family protein [Riemerella columbina]|uniref:HmuY family protein n=1 Tax=Riemerella columbina TaxID=103810 RepID=UPI00036AB4B4|nr:HmuY family protein [Riemerella columbina]